MKEITEQMLDQLRQTVMTRMSPKRFRHTVAVEAMVVRLCDLYCPELVPQMRAAALLHDVTKELDTDSQEALCRQYGIPFTPLDHISPKTYHARTAAEQIRAEFPQFADPIIVNAVRWHTTGHKGMTLTEKLLYLADYIDESRTFESCVILRRYFFGAQPERMDARAREALLRDTLLLSYDFTVRDLLEEGKPIATDTVEARNELILAGKET
ncbi:MAG: HD domain-containing protein [Clostridia bacterium]|nr:HD domain-containing protein [Clostridia bacterium]